METIKEGMERKNRESVERMIREMHRAPTRREKLWAVFWVLVVVALIPAAMYAPVLIWEK